MTLLPTPYWIQKLYKSAIGTRFISTSKHCVIKSLSKNITAAFKLLYKSMGKCHNESKFYAGINWFWVFYTLYKLVTEKQPSPSQHMIFQHYITTYRLQTN